ncbi:AP-3 complex subunit delta-1 [Erysiphe neolycopersici]|uniref:AP-3 complex subunit delta n=1 Tax=Erysiphe neolycopersici TaxID=212602 RepID=A0A420HYQ4_9PEZI|nr:AP-3 complex subunit delta-1 [Erysiphe neolycopersici]
MFGHDMSWAAFNVIEVMTSTNYLQKRVGYLGAMQSFRTDTDVLVLATSLIKKDLTSTSIPTISLPITTLPHIVTSSLAHSTLQDLLPRMNHSDPAVRKKVIVTLYRLALVYPETLRPAWPKIKNSLVDENEDASVTAAIVNVVCELGWRRPQDFLPLAPRLFELLVNGGNNWMAIKLIKLFAALTPLEPRLIRKLLRPLTSIIRTTPAMSLQYECINGIIQGGILDINEESSSGEEIATLCVSKLRDMIMVEGDANLKFVALLAFNKIVITHPSLVAQQEDVIMECIDSPDLSIRLRALDVVVGMVNNDNLVSIISRLMRQLKDSLSGNSEKIDEQPKPIEMISDLDDESSESMIGRHTFSSEALFVPDDYKLDVVSRILDMCSSNNYSNLMDFDWYINVLVQLIHLIPSPLSSSASFSHMNLNDLSVFKASERIGDELRNIAVKVRAVRKQVTRAAESVLISTSNNELPPNVISCGVLGPIGWIVGEFASELAIPESTLTALLHLLRVSIKPNTIVTYLHTIPKIFSFITSDNQKEWTQERKTMISLLLAKIIYAFEPFTNHPDLEVQERAVEFSELLKLTMEASSNQKTSVEDSRQEAPLLLTQVLPSLFSGLELKSIAPSAQKNVPLPIELDLEQVLNVNLTNPLINALSPAYDEPEKEAFDIYYHKPFPSILDAPKAISGHTISEESLQSYHEGNIEGSLDSETCKRRLVERMERHRDDPFYIFPTDEKSKGSVPPQNLLETSNGLDLDPNQIPILQLDNGISASQPVKNFPAAKSRKKVEVAVDETLVASDTLMTHSKYSEGGLGVSKKIKRDKNSSLLQVDSSHIGSFSLDEDLTEEPNNCYQEDDAQILKEMKEVEMKRLEILRGEERILAPQGVEGGIVIKKKKKKKKLKPVKIESNIIDLESTQSKK